MNSPPCAVAMAALLGTVPIAIGFGAGADLRQPLGVAAVGGLTVSQALTLFTTPATYVYMDRLNAALSRRRQNQSIARAADVLGVEAKKAA